MAGAGEPNAQPSAADNEHPEHGGVDVGNIDGGDYDESTKQRDDQDDENQETCLRLTG